MKLLLDTTVLVDALRAKGGRRVLLEGLLLARHDLSVVSVSVAEVYAGVRPGEEGKVAAFLLPVFCYAMDFPIARRAGLLRNAEARRGRTMSLTDAMIAATALEHGRTLVTENRKDFIGSGVPLFSIDFPS